MSIQHHLAHTARWLGLAGLVIFTVIGLVTRQPADAGLSLPAAMLAAGAGALLVRHGSRNAAAFGVLAALATAGVVGVEGGKASNVGWFAVCILAAWSMLAGGPWIGAAYWIAGVALFGAEWLWGTADPGWRAWVAGVTSPPALRL